MASLGVAHTRQEGHTADIGRVDQFLRDAGTDDEARAGRRSLLKTAPALRTVPAPTMTSGASSAINRIASSASGVRRVTSIAG